MSQLSTYRVYNNSSPSVSLPQTHSVYRSGSMSNSSHTARNPSYRPASGSAGPVIKSSDHNDVMPDGLGGERSMPLLDLHGFTKENAIRQLTTFLERHEMAPWVCVVTGTGSHSPDGPVIRNAVKKLLTKRKMEFRKLTPGSFMVNASTGIVLHAPDPPVDTKLKVIPRPSPLSNVIRKSVKDESSNAGHGRAATENDIVLRPISRKKRLLIEQQSRHHQPQTENNQDVNNPGRVVPYPHHARARQPYLPATLNASSTGVTSSGWGDTGGMARSVGGGYSRPSTRGPRPMPSMSELARESDTSDPAKLLMDNDPVLKRRMSAPVPSTGSSDREEKELLKALEMSKEWEERRRRDSKIASELMDREEELLKQALTMSEHETETERRLREEEEKIFQQILEASKTQAEKEKRTLSAGLLEIADDDEDAQLRAALAESVANTPAPGHMDDDDDDEEQQQLKAVLELSLKEAKASLPPSMLDCDEEESKHELNDSPSKLTSSAGEYDGDAEFKAALAASMNDMVAIRPVSRVDPNLAFRPTSESRRPSDYQQPVVAQKRASKRLSRKDVSVGEQKDEQQHHYHPPSASTQPAHWTNGDNNNNDHDEPLVPLSVARAQVEEEQARERHILEKRALAEAQNVARRASKVTVAALVDRATTVAAPGTAIAVPLPVPETTTTTTTRVSVGSVEAASSSVTRRNSERVGVVTANSDGTKSSCCIIL